MEAVILMKKSFRRIFLALMCLMLCLALAVSALAEGPLAALFKSASTLAFDTHNVTLNAKATFTYDGELFKTLNGDYVQDDGRSFLKIMLDTPKEDGTIYTGGYTVVGEGLYAYAIDTYNNGFYTTTSTQYADTLLKKNAQTDALVNFGALLLELAESTMDGAVTINALEQGTRYDVKLTSGQTPEILNAALSLLATGVARDRYGYAIDTQSNVGTVWLEDWDALFATIYQQLYGTELPKDFLDRYYSASGKEYAELGTQYHAVLRKINEMQAEASLAQKEGVTLILRDGTSKHFDTMEEYYIATDNQYPQYEDYDMTFKAYYKAKTGEDLSEDVINAVYFGTSEKLNADYYALMAEMNQHYVELIKADPKAVSAQVHADGTYELAYKLKSADEYGTVKERILRQMTALELDQADCSVETDAQGRIISGKGKVTLNVVDQKGAKHPLTVDFEATAGAYGESTVKEFNPEDYNVVDVSAFYRDYATEEDVEPEGDLESSGVTVPETVTFNGQTYTIPKY